MYLLVSIPLKRKWEPYMDCKGERGFRSSVTELGIISLRLLKSRQKCIVHQLYTIPQALLSTLWGLLCAWHPARGAGPGAEKQVHPHLCDGRGTWVRERQLSEHTQPVTQTSWETMGWSSRGSSLRDSSRAQVKGEWWNSQDEGKPEKCRGGTDKGKSGTMSLRRKLQAWKSDAVLWSSQSSPQYYCLLIEMFLIFLLLFGCATQPVVS